LELWCRYKGLINIGWLPENFQPPCEASPRSIAMLVSTDRLNAPTQKTLGIVNNTKYFLRSWPPSYYLSPTEQ